MEAGSAARKYYELPQLLKMTLSLLLFRQQAILLLVVKLDIYHPLAELASFVHQDSLDRYLVCLS